MQISNERKIISLKEARKILGQVADQYSDKEILDMIESFEQMARFAFRDLLPQNSSKG